MGAEVVGAVGAVGAVGGDGRVVSWQQKVLGCDDTSDVDVCDGRREAGLEGLMPSSPQTVR